MRRGIPANCPRTHSRCGPICPIRRRWLLTPSVVADKIVDAILTDRFWVITHSDLTPVYQGRFAEILANSPGQEPP
jgi:hypothetical protein